MGRVMFYIQTRPPCTADDHAVGKNVYLVRFVTPSIMSNNKGVPEPQKRIQD